MKVLKVAVAVKKVDTFMGNAYRSGNRNRMSCGCTCY